MLPELCTPIPGPRSTELAKALRAHECRNVTYVSPEFPVFWEKAEGANVWDADGNRFLDLTSGFGVATLGFARSEIVAAVQKQVAQLGHAMGDVHPTAGKAELCRELSRITFERWGAGPGKVTLGSAGFEAVEAALKTAHLKTGKRKVIAFEGGYHGLGYGALSVTGRDDFQGPFRAQLADFAEFLPYPHRGNIDAAALEQQLREVVAQGDVGAILVEPVQGRGGEIIPPDWFLPLLRKLADRFGMVLIFDEIYTGFHRTGPLFACERWGVVPDLICVGKALSGTLPISACVGRADVMDAWPESRGEALHTSTFLGNPIAVAAALASLEVWRSRDWADEIAGLGAQWEKALKAVESAHPKKIREVRGSGLMWGIDLPDAVQGGAVVTGALKRGIILLSGGVHGNVLTLSPSVCVTGSEIEWVGNALAEILAEA